jgi:NADH-quinone oxidoreductase subunit G
MDTVTLTIDGRQITVEKGKTVLQAAIEHGISIPYYCYHPGIGIDGSCRVCIVKIEKMPKLQTSCSTMCTDGLAVDTRSPEVIAARAGVFEFLLVNHPLDCPVCDKGGECPLQDFSYTFGPERSRMEFPRRVFDGEGVKGDVDFGPTLMLNRQRCILCTRCVRFMRDIDGDAQINIVDRGYGSEIATFQEEGVHSLISGNLMDVCPVGAITTRDYRFKSRPWDNPVAIDTICTQCSKGCNTTAWIKAKPEWARGSRLIRFTPRLNPEVNNYWMCDIGRFEYHWIEGDDRLQRPLARAANGDQEPVSWHEMNARLTERLGAAGRSNPDGVRFLLSAHASHEELFLFRRLAEELVGDAKTIAVGWRYQPKAQPAGSKFTVPPVDAPNVAGARAFGLVPADVDDASGGGRASSASGGGRASSASGGGRASSASGGGRASSAPTTLREDIEAGKVAALYVFDPGPEGSLGDLKWLIDARNSGRLPLLIVQGVVLTPLARAADFVLPGACYVEKEAAYTNDKGLLQGASRVMPPPGDALEDWQILTNLGVALGVPFNYTTAADVRADIARKFADRQAFAGIAGLTFGRPVEARNWLQASNPSERWKWDFMFQDLPPVKGAVDPSAVPIPVGAIPLKEVK